MKGFDSLQEHKKSRMMKFMLTKDDLEKIGEVIDQRLEVKLEEKLESKLEEKLNVKFDEKLEPIKKEIKTLKNNDRKIRKDLNLIFRWRTCIA